MAGAGEGHGIREISGWCRLSPAGLLGGRTSGQAGAGPWPEALTAGRPEQAGPGGSLCLPPPPRTTERMGWI